MKKQPLFFTAILIRCTNTSIELATHFDVILVLRGVYLVHKKARLCSTCNGAFFLASTGYLDGKEATTSWFASSDFRSMFPKVKLMDEK